MRIPFTGASSFTGYWFVRELVPPGTWWLPPVAAGISNGCRGTSCGRHLRVCHCLHIQFIPAPSISERERITNVLVVVWYTAMSP